MVTIVDPLVEPHAKGMPSLVTPPPDNAHNLGDNGPNYLDSLIGTISHNKVLCTGGSWFQERCCHGNWRWCCSPCDKWSCEACRRRRVETELIPEILEALNEARRRRVTLKHLVLTWRGDDLGAQPTAAGAKRRALDLAHLAQWLRRDRKSFFEYLKVAETHKSGKVHFHLLAIMPKVKQAELSHKWEDFARKSFKVGISACGIRCPNCWPGRDAPA